MGRISVVRTTVAAVAVLVVGACGTSSGGGGGGASGGMDGRGPITLAKGKDTTGTEKAMLDRWNKDHPNEKVTLIELPESADAQRQQFIGNAQTKSDVYTVLGLDVVWTAEFAANKWVDALPQDQLPLDKFLPPALDTAKYRDKLYAVPYNSNGGLLYYRKDLLSAAGIQQPPTTWAEMGQDCQKVRALPAAAGVSCYAGQFEKYEGLTVNFTEVVNSAGGVVVDDTGKPNVNTPQAKAGVQFLADAFASGAIPKETITFKEEESRRAFQDGKYLFENLWPYAYDLMSKTDGSSQVVGKFAVAPLPGLTGPGASTIGGYNLAISSFAKNKATALDFIKFFTNEDNEKLDMKANSNAPVYTALYDDPELVSQFTYLPVLKQAILNAKPRPKVVRYGEVTAAIQDAAYGVITGTKTPDSALADLQSKLEALIH